MNPCAVVGGLLVALALTYLFERCSPYLVLLATGALCIVLALLSGWIS